MNLSTQGRNEMTYHILIVDKATGCVLQSIPCNDFEVDHLFTEISYSERKNPNVKVYVREWN
jgi:hypothetical protein